MPQSQTVIKLFNATATPWIAFDGAMGYPCAVDFEELFLDIPFWLTLTNITTRNFTIVESLLKDYFAPVPTFSTDIGSPQTNLIMESTFTYQALRSDGTFENSNVTVILYQCDPSCKNCSYNQRTN